MFQLRKERRLLTELVRHKNSMNTKNILFKVLVSVFAMSVSGNAFHTFHTSLTRMDYNEKEKLIEITIQLFTHDLVPVLEKKAGSAIDLEKDADNDNILLDYLDENFILNRNGVSIGKLAWVGKETKVDRVYVYVEIPYEGSFENLELKNSIFFESFPAQTNLVTFHFGDSKADLVFKIKDKFKKFAFVKKALN
jgi:hypothetical protein